MLQDFKKVYYIYLFVFSFMCPSQLYTYVTLINKYDNTVYERVWNHFNFKNGLIHKIIYEWTCLNTTPIISYTIKRAIDNNLSAPHTVRTTSSQWFTQTALRLVVLITSIDSELIMLDDLLVTTRPSILIKKEEWIYYLYSRAYMIYKQRTASQSLLHYFIAIRALLLNHKLWMNGWMTVYPYSHNVNLQGELAGWTCRVNLQGELAGGKNYMKA